MNASLVDQAARDRIANDLKSNLFVEAGAGAGKTTSLVGRLIGLVRSGVEIESIAAITFTEKAAAELRHRLRHDLTGAVNALAEAGGDNDGAIDHERARLQGALDRLDHAPIGTLHAFARRILNDFPIAAGLPPGFKVLDEIESNIRFDERWEQFLDQLLSRVEPPEGITGGGARFLDLLLWDDFSVFDRGAGTSLRKVADDFHNNWDLVDEIVDLSDPGDFELDRSVFERFRSGCEALQLPDDDKQVDHRARVLSALGEFMAAGTDGEALQRLSVLIKQSSLAAKRGNRAKWTKAGLDLDACRTFYADLHQTAFALRQQAYDYRRRLLGAILGRWVLAGVDERRREGALEFHDLLVLARQLLTLHPTIRAALHDRYQRVLLDEFQDTDPIQLAIAVRLTASPDDPAQAQGSNWRDLQPLPGRLFIVGDPKQSIYRFRRADIAQYLRAADQVGADEVSLTSNFRSTAAVIDWVNEVFGTVIEADRDSQPEYQPLDVGRPTPNAHGSVTILGAEPLDLSADEIRAIEARRVVGSITDALSEGWLVGDMVPDHDGTERRTTRPCRPSDICVLLPSRLSLRALESELVAANVPYRAENSSVVYETVEIRELLMALRAADDLTDELSLVASLRTPLFGVSDRQLYQWRAAGGHWNIFGLAPDGLADHPVAEAFGCLRDIRQRSTTEPPAELIHRLVVERRVLETALDHIGARDVWRRVRFIIEQARAWNDAGGRGLRRYLNWAARQAAESRSADTVLPETDHDAVRIMTVHAAKGLEFPITMLSGMSSAPSGARAWSVIWEPNDWLLAQRDDAAFVDVKPLDEQMSDHERRRLLYVGCTRAVDHLVVSLHHKATKKPSRASGALLAQHGAHEAGGATEADPDPTPIEIAPDGEASPALDFAEWETERRSAFREASRSRSISATALAAQSADVKVLRTTTTNDPGIDKEPVDIDLPPWKRGRYGTAIGRAVHAVLQYCDLETGADIDAHATAQCAAEGIFGFDDTVAALARSAIGAPIVQRAAAGPHHRELFVAAGIDDIVFEGYVDLFLDTDEGGIIVDYKTDAWDDSHDRDERIAKYRMQLATYGVALEQVLGRPVAAAMLVRCVPGQPADEIEIPEWHEAVEQARRSGLTVARGDSSGGSS